MQPEASEKKGRKEEKMGEWVGGWGGGEEDEDGSQGLLVPRENTRSVQPPTFEVRKLRLREVESLLQGCPAP